MKVLCAGSFVCDIIAAHLPAMGAPGSITYAPRGIELAAGGHSANVSIDLSQLGLRGVAAAGAVGEDPLGEFIEGSLRRSGVTAYAERLGSLHTAKNVALSVEGEDVRFYAELAANTMLSPAHVVSVLGETEPEIFHLGTVGGLRLIDGELPLVLGEARRMGCTTVVDVVMPEGGEWGHLTPALPLADVLHCNSLEGASLTGAESPGEALDRIVEAGVKLAVITRGAAGLVAAKRGMKLEMPAFRVEAVDPTGAGDAFCAGFIHALLEAGLSGGGIADAPLDALKKVLLVGGAAGAACVTAPGATTAVTKGAVEGLIRCQGGEVLSDTTLL